MSRESGKFQRFATTRSSLPVLALIACSAHIACSRDWDAFERDTTSPTTATGSGGAGGTASASDSTTSIGGADAASSGTISASTGGPPADVGCSDGTREGYVDMATETSIAGCAGGFDVAGVTTTPSQTPQCNRIAGNDSANPNGTGCSVDDLCAAGWHVCNSAMDVKSSASTGQCEAPPGTPIFWLTRQAQTGMGICSGALTTNNLVGCGSLGGAPQGFEQCAPLARFMRSTDCNASMTWACGMGNTVFDEAAVVTHKGPTEGGVLCCKG